MGTALSCFSLLPLRPLVLLLVAGVPWPAGPPAPAPYFSGRIVYENEYQTLAGEPLYYAVKPRQKLEVQGASYKLYDRHGQPAELYRGEANELYRFEQGRAVRVPDTARSPAPRPVLTCLPATATILGYRCQVLRLASGSTATLVFYAPALRVPAAGYARCPSRYWATLLQATDGALPLRTLTVDARRDYTASSQAIAVEALPLPAADFAPDTLRR